MKAVLISINPKRCELIASGKKTIEIRKTRPKIDTPFKCYIYCTKSDKSYHSYSGKIIGEFVCDAIYGVLSHPDEFAGHPLFFTNAIENACMTNDEVEKFSSGKDVYGWHISELMLYDEPKRLKDFNAPCIGNEYEYCQSSCRYAVYYDLPFGEMAVGCDRRITSAPKSFRYVENIV